MNEDDIKTVWQLFCRAACNNGFGDMSPDQYMASLIDARKRLKAEVSAMNSDPEYPERLLSGLTYEWF